MLRDEAQAFARAPIKGHGHLAGVVMQGSALLVILRCLVARGHYRARLRLVPMPKPCRAPSLRSLGGCEKGQLLKHLAMELFLWSALVAWCRPSLARFDFLSTQPRGELDPLATGSGCAARCRASFFSLGRTSLPKLSPGASPSGSSHRAGHAAAFPTAHEQCNSAHLKCPTLSCREAVRQEKRKQQDEQKMLSKVAYAVALLVVLITSGNRYYFTFLYILIYIYIYIYQ